MYILFFCVENSMLISSYSYYFLTVPIAHGCGLTLIEYSGLSHRYSNPVSIRGTLRAVDVDRMWLSVAGDKDGPNNATIPFPNNSHTATNQRK